MFNSTDQFIGSRHCSTGSDSEVFMVHRSLLMTSQNDVHNGDYYSFYTRVHSLEYSCSYWRAMQKFICVKGSIDFESYFDFLELFPFTINYFSKRGCNLTDEIISVCNQMKKEYIFVPCKMVDLVEQNIE